MCLGCRDNTAGQHCDQCARYFYPNTSKELADPDMCLGEVCVGYGPQLWCVLGMDHSCGVCWVWPTAVMCVGCGPQL